MRVERIEEHSTLTAVDIFRRIVDGGEFVSTPVKIADSFVEFAIDDSVLRDIVRRDRFSAAHEAQIAEVIYRALDPARRANPALLRDPGLWAWVGLVPFRAYVLIRWCGASRASMVPSSSERCEYFLTGDSLVRQARCGVRRLWIAADASMRARGDFSIVRANLAFADLYTGVFERMLGLDAELACLLTEELSTDSYDEDSRRRVLVGIGARLSTIAVEYLDAGEKRQLLTEVLSDLGTHPSLFS